MPLLRRLVLALAVVLLLLANPAMALAQTGVGQIVASGRLDGPSSRVLSLSLRPTADGRAVGTLRFVDRAAGLRLRALRFTSVRVEDGVVRIVATAAIGRSRGYEARLALRGPSRDGERAGLELDVTGPAGSYRTEGELVGGVARLPAARAAALPEASSPATSVALAVAAVAMQASGLAPRAIAAPSGFSGAAASAAVVPPQRLSELPTAAAPATPAPPTTIDESAAAELASSALALVQRLELPAASRPAPSATGSSRAGATSPIAPVVPRPIVVDEPSALAAVLGRLAVAVGPATAAALADGATADVPASAPLANDDAIGATSARAIPIPRAVALLGARLADDPELGAPARALAAELRPLIEEQAAAHPAESQAIAQRIDAAVAVARRERGPSAELAFAALLDRARAVRARVAPDGSDSRFVRDVFAGYSAFRESWARATAATVAERSAPSAWAAATALGISLIDDESLLAAGETALTDQLAATRGDGIGARGATASGSLPLDNSVRPRLPDRRAGGGTISTARLGELDFPIEDGHFFTQTGRPERAGFAVADRDGIPFWSAFQELGGVPVLGYPASHRLEWDGFTVQVFQRAVLQWRPESGEVFLVNVLDQLHAGGLDPWLLLMRQTPSPRPPTPDPLRPWDDAGARIARLDAYPELRAAYGSTGLAIHGLPTSDVVDMGNHYAVRTQRTVLQLWKQDVPWAEAGQVTVALAGDIVKESGLLPDPWALEPLPWIETS